MCKIPCRPPALPECRAQDQKRGDDKPHGVMLKLHPAVQLPVEKGGLTDEQAADDGDQPRRTPAGELQNGGQNEDQAPNGHYGGGPPTGRTLPLGGGGVNAQQRVDNGNGSNNIPHEKQLLFL